MQTRTTFQNLKQAIFESGIKQRFIANRLGVSETLFSHQIAGRRKMNHEQVKILAKLLKLKIKEIKELM